MLLVILLDLTARRWDPRVCPATGPPVRPIAGVDSSPGPDQSYGSMDSMDLAEGVDRDRSATTTTATAAAGAAAAAGSDGKSNSNSNITTTTSSPPASPSAASSAAAGLGRAVGARVQASSAAFEADSRDMGVLLSVETLQVGSPWGQGSGTSGRNGGCGGNHV